MTNAPELEPAVRISGLRVVRGTRLVLDDLHVDVPRGQITGILGPSGCGKTTLMRAIVGVQRIRGGQVTVLGSPAGSRSLRRSVAYDTQAASVYDDLTVQQNLVYFARALGAPTSAVAYALGRVNLAPHAHTLVSRLSGGQRGRVSLGIALLGSPEILVLDEPTVGLDPLLRQELWELFRSIADSGTTLLISSHVMDEALRCDRLVLLREGRIIADTTPAALLADTESNTPDEAFLRLVAQRDTSTTKTESP